MDSTTRVHEGSKARGHVEPRNRRFDALLDTCNCTIPAPLSQCASRGSLVCAAARRGHDMPTGTSGDVDPWRQLKSQVSAGSVSCCGMPCTSVTLRPLNHLSVADRRLTCHAPTNSASAKLGDPLRDDVGGEEIRLRPLVHERPKLRPRGLVGATQARPW